MPYHVVRRSVHGENIFTRRSCFLREHRLFTFTHVFPKLSNAMYMAALPVPLKSVRTNRYLQLLAQNITSILPCLFLPGLKVLRQSYHVCLPAQRCHEIDIISAAVTTSLGSTCHRSNTKDSAISVISGGLADLSMPLRLNISVISPGFLQQRTSIEELEL